jgi:predicted dehydrogenase
MKPVRICQIGCGYWGPNLMRNVDSGANTELAAICDLRPEILKSFSGRYPGAKTYSSMDNALADPDIDAVIIATPSGLHFEHAKRALEAGKHVMVEKPLADTVEQALVLSNLAAARKLTLMVGHTFLYNNIVHRVGDIIRSGELGDLHYLYAQRLNLGRFRTDSDVLWTLAPHDVSIINYWLQDRPTEVRASGFAFVHKSSGVAEVCFAEMQYASGVAAHLHLSWLDPQKRRDMVIVGTRKMLLYDDMNADRHLQIFDKSAEADLQASNATFADYATRVRAGDLVIPAVRLKEPLAVEVAHFADCVRTGATPVTGAQHAIDVTAVLEAMTRSMKSGNRPVRVEYP